MRLLLLLIGPPALFVLSMTAFANGDPTPPAVSPSPVYGIGPPNLIPPPGVTFPCVPPGPFPSLSMIDPPSGSINVRANLSRIVIRVETLPNVSGKVSITSGKHNMQLNLSRDATLEASSNASASVVLSAPLPLLKRGTSYHVAISGWEFSTSPCRKAYFGDLGSFTTGR
jgi:hypothetical protein